MRMHEFPKPRRVLEQAFASMSHCPVSLRLIREARRVQSTGAMERELLHDASSTDGCSTLKTNNIMRNSDL